MTPDTFVSTGTDGKISLREAIQAANFDDLADTIDFAPSLNGQTILLTQGELTITDSLTIDASMLGSGLKIDAGNGADNDFGTGDGTRVFNITLSAANQNVTLDNLTITGGDVLGDGTFPKDMRTAPFALAV